MSDRPFASAHALVADNVSVRRGERAILEGLSFRVEAGKALILTGANGSGKTTLLRAIAGFLPLAAGHIVLDGIGDDQPVASRAHVVGHLDGLKRQSTARDNLAFWAAYLGGDRSGAGIVAAMDAMGLANLAEFPAGDLSAGQKRRLGLARLLVARRPLWLLDEPTVSLDTHSVGLLVAAMKAHLADGGLVVVATHVALELAGARELRLGEARVAAPGAVP